VTAADNGTTLHLAVGQQFLLDLGSAVDWTVTVADQRVVGRVIGVFVIRGAQGIYEARTAGTTLLSAVGSPPCPSGGACPCSGSGSASRSWSAERTLAVVGTIPRSCCWCPAAFSSSRRLTALTLRRS